MFCNKRIAAFLILFSLLFSVAFAESSSNKSSNEEELPQSLLDARRFEIITFGALPFVMLDTTLVYSSTQWAMNGFSGSGPTAFATSSRFSSTEQKNLVLASLGVSIGVGLTDFIFRIIKRNRENKKQEIFNSRDVLIVPVVSVDEDPEAVRIPVPGEDD